MELLSQTNIVRDKILSLLFLLTDHQILITPTLISELINCGTYAEEVVNALILLKKFDEFNIFLTSFNITSVINARSHASELAMAIVWFTSSTITPNALITPIVNALACAKNITDLAVALAALSYITPLKSQTIQAITESTDPRRVVNKLLFFK